MMMPSCVDVKMKFISHQCLFERGGKSIFREKLLNRKWPKKTDTKERRKSSSSQSNLGNEQIWRRPQKKNGLRLPSRLCAFYNLWKFMDSWAPKLEGRKQQKRNATYFPPQSLTALYWDFYSESSGYVKLSVEWTVKLELTSTIFTDYHTRAILEQSEDQLTRKSMKW